MGCNLVEGEVEVWGGSVCDEKSLWIGVYRQPKPSGPGKSRGQRC